MSRGQVFNVTGDTLFAWEGEALLVHIFSKHSAGRHIIGKPQGTQLNVSVTAAPLAGRTI